MIITNKFHHKPSSPRCRKVRGLSYQDHVPSKHEGFRERKAFKIVMIHPAFFICLAISVAGIQTSAADESLRWFKGNTHTHTLWSDGNDFPDMVTDWYVTHGYNFLSLSDHNVLHAKEVWMTESLINKRKIALGKTPLEKYRARFGNDWVETRTGDHGVEVRLKRLDEYRPKFEKPGQFLLVQAEELSANFTQQGGRKVPIHMNAVNIREVIKPVEGYSVRDVMRKNLQAIRDQEKALGIPILAHVNHPNFQWALTAEDLAEVLEEEFFEVFNGHPKIYFNGDDTRAGCEELWDIANTLRLAHLHSPPLLGVATDDSHHYHGGENTPGRGWVMVRSKELKAEALIKAMRSGDFYASSGVTLDDMHFENNTLHIRIHAEPEVTYSTRIIGTPKKFDATVRDIPSPADDPNPVRKKYSADVGKVFATIQGTEITYKLSGEELYIRASISSSKPHPTPSFTGQTEAAWTQPVGWHLDK